MDTWLQWRLCISCCQVGLLFLAQLPDLGRSVKLTLTLTKLQEAPLSCFKLSKAHALNVRHRKHDCREILKRLLVR